MPLYEYKGYHALSGDSVKGKLEADNIKLAKQKLKQSMKILVAEISQVSSPDSQADGQSSPSSFVRQLLRRKIKLDDLSVMTRQLATLQSAHVPIDDSLTALVQQVENESLSHTIAQVKDGVFEGKALGEAMAPHGHCFDRMYVNMVSAGEASGTLPLVLSRLADFLEYKSKVKSDLISALLYPLIMISASLLIIVYLFVSVVPKLEKVFASMKVKLPFFTELLISISRVIQNHYILLIVTTVVLCFLLARWLKTPSGRTFFDRFSLRVPIFGPIIMRVNISRFTKTLSTLLSSGVPIVAALEITKNIVGNTIIVKVIEQAKQSVQEGESLGLTIEKSGEFPPLVCHMIKTGEKTGEMETMLEHVAKAYDVEVERKIASMVTLIEPAMIIVMGGVVVVVVVAMLVPMLSIMSQVR
ncbi:MAG: type II secretion system F family protein [Proteobacteria bacterium]|nr:type II secretion system F family protein [Pseudomonadota bacterium]